MNVQLQRDFMSSQNGAYMCFINSETDTLSYSSVKSLMPDCSGFSLSINFTTTSPDQVSILRMYVVHLQMYFYL